MPQVSRSLLLPYSAHEMFQLVNDVARYREFLPFCIASEVIAESGDEVHARIAFSRMGLEQALTTRNRLLAPERIHIEFVDGPFEYLRGQWHFQALAETACKVNFEVDFQVQARFLQLAAVPALGQAAGQTIEAFQKRAVQVYGKR
ncbi:MAG: ubiquinone-binding protein [Moraxellaceae bacterium]|jgi:ribosome-associated toxin RatA of RatAB toxin-antitoxin module|nr:ubiquinone-binding protein [Moraxellaceae bacterium]